MTGHELRDARTALGLSQSQMAAVMAVYSARTIRKWEAEERDIPGPVRILIRILLVMTEQERQELVPCWPVRPEPSPAIPAPAER